MKGLAAAIIVAGSLGASSAGALEIVALTDANEFLRFDSASPQKTAMVAVQGTGARVLGIDMRPADGKLYGLDAAGAIYRIDDKTGFSEKIAELSVPLENKDRALVDFNPQANRMRVIGPGGQNLRVNVDTGQAVVDGRIAYAKGDANDGKTPSVTAGAYINSVAGATQTQLFDYDSANGVYVVQDPPNDGTLATIGDTGVPAGTPIDAADIHTDKAMSVYSGFAVAAGRLYQFSIANGKLREIGPIAAGTRRIVDIAVVSPP